MFTKLAVNLFSGQSLLVEKVNLSLYLKHNSDVICQQVKVRNFVTIPFTLTICLNFPSLSALLVFSAP